MCFGFERNLELIIEVNDAGVIDKGRNNPGSVDLVGGRFEVGSN